MMDFIEILAVAGMVWVLAIGLVIALCWSVRHGEESMSDELAVQPSPAERFHSTA